MRVRDRVGILFVAMLVPKIGSAQLSQSSTPPPQVTATAAPWQVDNSTIQLDGVLYRPTKFVRPFDGNVMAQVGYVGGIPVYADKTLEPFSVVYVPVARGMRTYERLRSVDLAGTTGSQAPAPPAPVPPVATALPEPIPVGTSGASTRDIPRRAAPTRIETVPRPRASEGVWIRYDGAKWYSDGDAVPYTAERFTQVGTYRGFAVYRERNRRASDIWVAVVEDGPVAPYAKR